MGTVVILLNVRNKVVHMHAQTDCKSFTCCLHKCARSDSFATKARRGQTATKCNQSQRAPPIKADSVYCSTLLKSACRPPSHRVYCHLQMHAEHAFTSFKMQSTSRCV